MLGRGQGFSFEAARASLYPRPKEDLMARFHEAGKILALKPVFDGDETAEVQEQGSAEIGAVVGEERRAPFSWEWEEHVIEKERQRREADEEAYCTSSEDDFGDPQLAVVRKLRHNSDAVNKCPICPSHGVVINLHQFRDAQKKSKDKSIKQQIAEDKSETGGEKKQEEEEEEEVRLDNHSGDNDDTSSSELFKFKVGPCGMCMESDVTTADAEAFFCYTCGTASLMCVVCAKLDMSCYLPSIMTEEEKAAEEETRRQKAAENGEETKGPCQGKFEFNARQLSANPFPQSRKRGKQRCTFHPECKWPWLYECSSCGKKMCIECFRSRRWKIVDAQKKKEEEGEGDEAPPEALKSEKGNSEMNNEDDPRLDDAAARDQPTTDHQSAATTCPLTDDPSTTRKLATTALVQEKEAKSPSKISIVSSSPSVQILSTPPAASQRKKPQEGGGSTKALGATGTTKGKKVQIQEQEGGAVVKDAGKETMESATGKRKRDGGRKSSPLSILETVDLLLEDEAGLEARNATNERRGKSPIHHNSQTPVETTAARLKQQQKDELDAVPTRSEEEEEQSEAPSEEEDSETADQNGALVDEEDQGEEPPAKRRRTEEQEEEDTEVKGVSNRPSAGSERLQQQSTKKRKKPLITPGRPAVVVEVLLKAMSLINCGQEEDKAIRLARFQDQFRVYDATKLFCRMCGSLFYPANIDHGVNLLQNHSCPALHPGRTSTTTAPAAEVTAANSDPPRGSNKQSNPSGREQEVAEEQVKEDWPLMEPQSALELLIHALKHPCNSASYM